MIPFLRRLAVVLLFLPVVLVAEIVIILVGLPAWIWTGEGYLAEDIAECAARFMEWVAP